MAPHVYLLYCCAQVTLLLLCCVVFRFIAAGHGDHQDEPEVERVRRQDYQLLLPQLLPLLELHDLDSGLHQEEHARCIVQIM